MSATIDDTPPSDSNTVTNDDDTTIEVNTDDPKIKDKKDEKDEISSNKGSKTKSEKIEFFLLILGLSFGVFLAALDQTIVATAVPAIASEFKALDKISWVANAYLLTSTGFQPIYGRLSDIFGRKATFLFAIIIFEIGSLLCGISPNMIVMIISRAIAGIGGGGIMSLVMVIISDIVSPQDNGKYQGIVGAIFGIASVIGPLLGGAFTDHVTWRWSFYINLPFGVVTIGVVIFFLSMPHPTGSLLQKLKRIDYAGIIVIFAATVAILLPLSWGGSKYAWNSPVIIVLLIVGAVGYLLFALIEIKFAYEPVAPPHLFKQLHVVGCFTTNFFLGVVFFGTIYYIPFYFEVVKADSATESGLELIPYILGVVVSSIISGQIVSRTDKISYRTLCLIGSALTAIGIGLITLWDENTGKGPQIGYMAIAGVGIGCIMQITILCLQRIVDNKDLATATTLLMFFRFTGSVFGVAIVGTVFSNTLVNNLEKSSIPPEYIAIVKQSATVVKTLPEEVKNPIIIAYVNALRTAFIAMIPLSILCFISSIFMGNHKPKFNDDNLKNNNEKITIAI